jgi:hypothetical protein
MIHNNGDVVQNYRLTVELIDYRGSLSTSLSHKWENDKWTK